MSVAFDSCTSLQYTTSVSEEYNKKCLVTLTSPRQ